MNSSKISGNVNIYPLLTGILTFIFFGFFNKYHICFREQFQLFLFTREYFSGFTGLPGGLSGYIGEFLTQFFLYPFAGTLIIAILISLVHLLTINILKKFEHSQVLLPLTFIPALLFATLLCDNFYPLSGLIGFAITLSVLLLYIKTNKTFSRLAFGIIAIPLLYFIAGGSYMMFIASTVTFEIIYIIHKKTIKQIDLITVTAGLIIIVLLGIIIPSLLRYTYLQVPLLQALMSDYYYDVKAKIPLPLWILFLLIPFFLIIFSFSSGKSRKPVIIIINMSFIAILFTFWGLKMSFNPNAEEIMFYDYQVRRSQWDKIIRHAEKEPPRNDLSLSMLNLALAKTGKMSSDLFVYRQNGTGGLFLGFENENVAPMLGNEIFYHLGFINASQYFVFESMESGASMQKSIRSVQRLTETNIINGNYNVASKYITLLEKTLFYKKWARSVRKFIEQPELIMQHPVWAEKRNLAIKNDFFFNVPEIEKALITMLDEHPSNKIAFEYLMSYYLINKNIQGFMQNLFRIEKLKYSQMPVLYQEAALFAVSLTNDKPELVANFPISAETKKRMRAYADIYTSSPNAKELLKDKFSSTFWYYFHFN